ncbi:MAG TPA: tetratricopeptide repeat protein [Methanoregula sp.]|nr:tetratricopeptide repeat protein [Methanoregula sp.]
MQQSAGIRRILMYFSPSLSPGRFLVYVLLVALVCLPAQGYPVSARITSGSPATGIQLSAAAYEYQGMALMARRNWNGVITTTDEGLAVYPDDAELYCLRAYALRKTGYFTEAADNASHAIRIDPKPVRYANRGFALLALGRNEDALHDANTAIAINKSYTPAYGVKVIALFRMNNLTGAEQVIDTVMPSDPKNPLFWHLKAKISAAEGNCSSATEAFHQSIEIDPDYDLPWPGFENATTDLKNIEKQCTVPAREPVPTQATFPAVFAGAAIALAILTRER